MREVLSSSIPLIQSGNLPFAWIHQRQSCCLVRQRGSYPDLSVMLGLGIHRATGLNNTHCEIVSLAECRYLFSKNT